MDCMPNLHVIGNFGVGVVDHDTLVEALRAGWIAGTALDVTEPLPRDHPLPVMENVIITPHLGSATRQTRQE